MAQWDELTKKKASTLYKHIPSDAVGLCFWCKEWVRFDDAQTLMEMDVHEKCYEPASVHLAKIMKGCYKEETCC